MSSIARTLITFFFTGAAALSLAAEPAQIADLITQLAAENFSTREKASSDLNEITQKEPQKFIQTLAQAYENTQDPEVKTRLRIVLLERYSQINSKNQKGYMGIMHDIATFQINGAVKQGVFIRSVIKNSPAHIAGLETGDFIVKFNGLDLTKLPINDVLPTFSEAVKNAGAFKLIELDYFRAGKIHTTKVKLASYEAIQIDAGNIDKEFQAWLKKNSRK